jgi:hypothetical protein
VAWKVKATAWNHLGKRYKTVLEIEDDEVIDDEQARMIMYWIRNMEPGEKVVVRRFPPGDVG